MRDAKNRGDEKCDQTYATKIERGEARQELRSAHLRSHPTFLMSEALRRVDKWEDVGSSAGGSRS